MKPSKAGLPSLIAQMVKHLPAMQETGIQSPGQEDPLEKGMATHSSTLAWRIPRTGAWWATVHEVAKTDVTERLTLSSSQSLNIDG